MAENGLILLVDDDAALRGLLVRYLSENGYEVEAVADGVAMDAVLARRQPALLILDLMLPGEDGLAIARRLRGRGSLPIIILSARGDEVDRIVGLELGADDYLAKPFNPRELLARIRAVLRRNQGAQPQGGEENIHFGSCTLDLARHQLICEGDEVSLTSGEFDLLRVFAQHPNRVLERDTLMDLLKGYERSPFDRSIDVRVTRLRRKIEPDPNTPRYIRTIWGEGYMFCPEGDGRD